jgi:hypothetical protein
MSDDNDRQHNLLHLAKLEPSPVEATVLYRPTKNKELHKLLVPSGRGGRSKYEISDDKHWNLYKYLQDDQPDNHNHGDDDIDGPSMPDNDNNLEEGDNSLDGEEAMTGATCNCLLNMDDLIHFISTNFCCHQCAEKGIAIPIHISYTSIGLGTTLHFNCMCSNSDHHHSPHSN